MTTMLPPADDLDVDRIIDLLVLAFATDPGMRWLFPDPHRYRTAFPEMVRLVAGPSLERATTDVVGGGAGAAVWLPPGVTGDDDSWGPFFAEHVDADRLDEVFAWGAQVGEHHPTEPHWYLLAVGVDPYRQGNGHGSALLQKGLARCDRDGVPAYLESVHPRNRALYERHGFEAIGAFQVDGAPPGWAMLRHPC
jgi:ribosomal protein S18 acetylase RimI-like enzyme